MFTGLVEEVGTVRSVTRRDRYQLLSVAARKVLEGTTVGASMNIDGVCQTVTNVRNGIFTVETLAVSLEKTTLGALRPGRRVNLERAVTPATRMGGHIVQGHVDGTGTVREVRRRNENIYFVVELSGDLIRYCITEGSIAVDGTSLTIAELTAATVVMNIIPVTWDQTVLADRRRGDRVNIEVDVLARYVDRYIAQYAAQRGT